MKHLAIYVLSVLGLSSLSAYDAPWVAYPSANNTQYGVYHFRKSFEVDTVPESLVVHLSADNRYHLFVNGALLCYGPAKGDLQTWKYDVIDIAPYLQEGENQLAASVYNAGADMPMSMFSVQTAFFLKAADAEWAELNTDASWKVHQNEAYTPISYQEMLRGDNRWFYGYYACGPGDDIEGAAYPWGWQELDFEDGDWKSAEPLSFEQRAHWNLMERNIPFMADHRVEARELRKAEGTELPEGMLEGKTSWKIPANTEASLIIDYGVLTMGYPDLVVRGGAGSKVQAKYAEALYEEVNLKGHRDQVEGLTMFGVWDVFRPDGAERTFRPLWKRCYRYVQLNVTTGDEPLEVVSHSLEYSGYPYPEMAQFVSDDERLNQIFENALRTLAMCSGETYYDTPFYEQLSYGGDNRPIAVNSFYNSNDDRLFREVMRLYPQSANRETRLFKSAYPSRFDFDMGSWSLAWIQSLHDYYYFRGDSDFAAQFVEPIEGVLEYYERHLDEKRMIVGTVNSQNFMDWSIHRGNIPRREDGKITHSSILTLFYIHTLDLVEELYTVIGEVERAAHWGALRDKMKPAIIEQFWDEEAQLFTDRPGLQRYSQHANILAIVCDIIPEDEQKALLKRILAYDGFTEYASSYFSFYLFKIMGKLDMEELFVQNLDLWHKFLDMGLTTSGETGFASHDRSDCHAWAAHPAYYLLAYVCGIRPEGVGFERVRIEPHLGDLTEMSANMPHLKGRIAVDYTVKDDELEAVITLPDGLEGEFVWQGEVKALSSGVNRF